MTLDFPHCDYCQKDLPREYKMRAVGFTDFQGQQVPSVKTWCGHCETPDDIDHEAFVAFQKALRAQMAARPAPQRGW